MVLVDGNRHPGSCGPLGWTALADTVQGCLSMDVWLLTLVKRPGLMSMALENTAAYESCHLLVTTVRMLARLTSSDVLCRFQLERLGYFCVDPDSTPDHLVLNRTCSLKATKATVSALAK